MFWDERMSAAWRKTSPGRSTIAWRMTRSWVTSVREISILLTIVFFFSSRRRLTRLTCDWSSDVCSSDLHAVRDRAGIGEEVARRGGVELETEGEEVVHGVHHDAVAGDGVLAPRPREQRVDVDGADQRVGERPGHARERRGRVDGGRQPEDLEGEVVRPGIAPRHRERQPGRVGADDVAGVAPAEQVVTTVAVEANQTPAVDEPGQVRDQQDRRLRRGHVALERRVPRDDARQHRVHDLDLARGTERRAMPGSGDLLYAGRHEQDSAQEGGPASAHHWSAAFANASGSKSRSTQRRSAFGPTAITSRSSPNSASSWRHAPHGDAGGSASVATTMRRNPRAPAATPAPMAMRSAQMVRPYEALSTLVPTYTVPSAPSSAAPTRNLL